MSDILLTRRRRASSSSSATGGLDRAVAYSARRVDGAHTQPVKHGPSFRGQRGGGRPGGGLFRTASEHLAAKSSPRINAMAVYLLNVLHL